MIRNVSLLFFGLVLVAGSAMAAETVVTVNAIDATGVGDKIGTVILRDGKTGLEVVPRLAGLVPGPHGFHIHENPSCAAKDQDGKPVAGLAAGGHFDPDKTGKHEGPWSHGHRGDMPALAVNGDGNTRDRAIVPHVKVADVKGRSIIIHAGADNYADSPKPLGGGGPRVACGVIP
ncbi:Superoxide dismutase (Cu-Zn) 2 [Candidatus Terasakiella magnetica]|nr:Superoxide dismutase (Cu-Zn) 2 [Candidatus Terasakiella magnetica]